MKETCRLTRQRKGQLSSLNHQKGTLWFEQDLNITVAVVAFEEFNNVQKRQMMDSQPLFKRGIITYPNGSQRQRVQECPVYMKGLLKETKLKIYKIFNPTFLRNSSNLEGDAIFMNTYLKTMPSRYIVYSTCVMIMTIIMIMNLLMCD